MCPVEGWLLKEYSRISVYHWYLKTSNHWRQIEILNDFSRDFPGVLFRWNCLRLTSSISMMHNRFAKIDENLRMFVFWITVISLLIPYAINSNRVTKVCIHLLVWIPKVFMPPIAWTRVHQYEPEWKNNWDMLKMFKVTMCLFWRVISEDNFNSIYWRRTRICNF